MKWTVVLIVSITVAVAALQVWRALDQRLASRVWAALSSTAGATAGFFDLELVSALPEPAQRYFAYTIAPGTPLRTAVVLDMEGQIGSGTKEQPNYREMTARQILAPPHGLVWKVRAGPLSGSDGATESLSWTRFWLFGIAPIVRAGNNDDHRRSAFGRVVAEGAFWVPASLLPHEGVAWEPVDSNTARAVVKIADLTQEVDITVAADGRPIRVVIQRWSDVNPQKRFREQPFGGYLSEFEDFDGYRLPTVVEGGNHFGTDEYFPFFKARITRLRFPPDGRR